MAEQPVTVRLFAGARAAAGTTETTVAVPAGATVQDVLDRLVADRPAVAPVLPACSFLLDGVRARPGQGLGPGEPGPGPRTLDVLPPFSGG